MYSACIRLNIFTFVKFFSPPSKYVQELKVRCSELSVRIQTDEVQFRAKVLLNFFVTLCFFMPRFSLNLCYIVFFEAKVLFKPFLLHRVFLKPRLLFLFLYLFMLTNKAFCSKVCCLLRLFVIVEKHQCTFHFLVFVVLVDKLKEP